MAAFDSLYQMNILSYVMLFNTLKLVVEALAYTGTFDLDHGNYASTAVHLTMAWSSVLCCLVLKSLPSAEMSWVQSFLTPCVLLVSALSLPKPLVSAECRNLTFDPSLVTTQSGRIQETPILTVLKSDVCSKNTEQKTLHIVKYCFRKNRPPSCLTNSPKFLISCVRR